MSSNTAPLIRPFDPRDATAVIQIVSDGVAAQEELAKALNLEPDTGLVDHDGKKAEAVMRDRPEDCFVAERDGVVVGFMHVMVYDRKITLSDGTKLDRYLSVGEIDVAPSARGTKVGPALLRYADQIAEDRNCEVIGVLYLANNERTARMNVRCGYTLTKADLFGLGAPADSAEGVTRWKRLRARSGGDSTSA
jgi:GNAT superfamily N-acetyltransferase